MAATNTTANRSRAPQPMLRGDDHPTYGALVNMAEHLTTLIETGELEQARLLVGYIGEALRGAS